jgi:hypothetical protein
VSNSGLRKFAGRTCLLVATAWMALKFAIWRATGSVALRTSTVDALVDVGASLFQRPPMPTGRRIGNTGSVTGRAKRLRHLPRRRSWPVLETTLSKPHW